MYHNEVIYRAEASLQKIRNSLIYLTAILIIIYCIYVFKENPVVASIIIVFVLFVSLITGNSEVAVFSDRFELNINHPIKKFSLKRKFMYTQIESIDVDLRLTKRSFILFEILSSFLPGFSIFNTLKIKLNDGTEKIIKTSVYKEDVIVALKKIKQLAKNKIVVTGISE